MWIQPVKIDRRAYMDAVYALDRVRYAKLVFEHPMFEWQLRFLKSQHKFKVLDCARQAGKSSIVSVIPTWTAKFRPGSACFILADTEDNAKRDMAKIRKCMSRDPTYPELKQDSTSRVELKNGSSIEVLCATDKSARGPSKPAVVIPDEASRIEDIVLTSGIVPMLNDNPDCELIVPSTPNGRTGFFYRVFHDPLWERYYVRSPFTPTSGTSLEIMQTEEEFRTEQAKLGVFGYYSPRHMNEWAQVHIQLKNLGQQLYRQENCGEFVEPESQLFSYSDIAKAFQKDGSAPLRSGVLVRNDIQAFAEDDGNDNE
jgi:hypothetical protein